MNIVIPGWTREIVESESVESESAESESAESESVESEKVSLKVHNPNDNIPRPRKVINHKAKIDPIGRSQMLALQVIENM